MNEIRPLAPIEVIRSKYPIDHRVWFEIANIADNTDETFYLPGRKEMAQICGCSINTLRASYKRLSEKGYIVFLKESLKKTRPHIRIYYSKPVIMLQPNEKMLPIGKQTIIARKNKNSKDQVDIIYNVGNYFPQFLLHIIEGSTQTDSFGKKISDYKLIEIHRATGYCQDPVEITIAICELEGWTPSSGKIRSILRSLAARFYHGNLKMSRKNNLSKQKNNPLKKYLQTLLENGGLKTNFFPAPDCGFSGKHIDKTCSRLQIGEYVRDEDIPIQQLSRNRNILNTHRDDKHLLALNENFELVQLQNGYWNAIPVNNKIINEICQEITRRSEMSMTTESEN